MTRPSQHFVIRTSPEKDVLDRLDYTELVTEIPGISIHLLRNEVTIEGSLGSLLKAFNKDFFSLTAVEDGREAIRKFRAGEKDNRTYNISNNSIITLTRTLAR